MARSPVMNFMKQQGFTQEPPDRAALRFKGLQFQPTLVGSMMLVGILTQSPAIFLLVSALLWLNVLVPAANPFENFYNRFVARRRGRPPLTPAPGPRRFAQGMAAVRSEEHTSELQSRLHLVCRLLLEKKKKQHRRQLARTRRRHTPTACGAS